MTPAGKRRLHGRCCQCDPRLPKAYHAKCRLDVMPIFPLRMCCNFAFSTSNNMARYHETPTRFAAKTAEYRQRYSLYQPVHGKSSRKASVSKHGDKSSRERDALRASAESQGGAGRRRGTIRSKEHDDEEEVLRRVIEESKREVEGSGTGKRGGKRMRDGSDE